MLDKFIRANIRTYDLHRWKISCLTHCELMFGFYGVEILNSFWSNFRSLATSVINLAMFFSL